MKKLLVLMLAGCLIFTACTPKEDAVEEKEPVNETAANDTEDAVKDEESNQEPELRVLMPLPDTIAADQLENCTVAVSLEEGDVYAGDSGIMQMKVKVFVYDLYDMVEVSMLNAGDVIVINGEDVVVDSLETSDYGDVLINGGLDAGGFELRTDDSGVYYLNGYSDRKTWRELGEATIPVSQDFIYTDASDLDKEPVTWHSGDFLKKDSGVVYDFTPYNTTVVIQDGMITAMNRVYTP